MCGDRERDSESWNVQHHCHWNVHQVQVLDGSYDFILHIDRHEDHYLELKLRFKPIQLWLSESALDC